MKRVVRAATVLAALLAGPRAGAQALAPLRAPVTPPTATDDREPGFSLAEALRALVRAHPLLAAARAQVQASEHELLAAGLWTNPQLNIVYARSVGYTTYDPQVGAAQVGVSQLLETAGVPAARRRVAALERTATQLESQALRQSLVFDAHAAFVRLAAAHAQRGLLEAAYAQLERSAAVIATRVSGGLAPSYDATRMRLALAEARAREGEAAVELLAARTELAVAVGPGFEALEGAPRLDLYAEPALPSLATLRASLPEARLDVAVARTRSQGALAGVDVTRRAVFQGVAVFGGLAMGQGVGPNLERQVDVVVGLTVPLPVVNRGQGSIEAGQARAQAYASLAEAALREAERRLEGAFATVTQRRAALAAFRATEGDQARALAEAEAGYREGRLAIQGLVDAYTAVRDARVRGLELARDARLAEVALWRAAAQPVVDGVERARGAAP